MITGNDFYKVMCAMVPLYFAMMVAYSSVKWWKIFTPEQCSGINRFVAVFAVPVLSFHFISLNNPYQMDTKFILADTLSKVVVLVLLSLSAIFFNGSLDWLITLFSVATLPNTLVMGIPLLKAMYGDFTQSLMVQVVVLQCIIWYTLLLFLFEYRAATLLIQSKFPGSAAASITKFELDNDVISLDGRDPLRTESELDDNGRTIRVRIRRSTSSAPDQSTLSPSIAITPRASNLSNAEIFSINTPVQLLPHDASFGHADLAIGYRSVSPRLSGYASSDAYSLQPTPRASNFNELETTTATTAANTPVWTRSPVAGRIFRQTSPTFSGVKLMWDSPGKSCTRGERQGYKDVVVAGKEISFRESTKIEMPEEEADDQRRRTDIQEMPHAFVMMRLILIVVGRKLSRNPNTYSSILGLLWSLISFKAVHGSAAPDYRLWKEKGDHGDGDSLPFGPHYNVGHVGCCWIKRCRTTCCHCTGSSSTRDCAICLRKGIWIAPRHLEHRGYLWDASFITCNSPLLHISRSMKGIRRIKIMIKLVRFQ
ncbi:hypothetical protein I3760_15G021600 [Carya illinoinensis]|nr:hypothetical protein I3760_15G021600 [Carya illinoinensis]